MNSKYTGLQVEALLDKIQGAYTKEEVDALIGNIHNMHTEIVEALPVEGDSNIIYLVQKGETGTTDNNYDEYMFINSRYEYIGNTQIDLDGYVTNDELAGMGFLTAHQDISGKADQSDTYTKQEVKDIVNGLSLLGTKVVDVLPTENINVRTIYFVPMEVSEENNAYDEYMYINGNWEHIGSTKCNLHDYEKKAWMGTSAQYNALEHIDEDRLYLITDGTAPDGSNIVDLTVYYTKDESDGKYQPKGNYLTPNSLTTYYTSDYIDSKLSVISAALNELSDRISTLEGTK